MRAVTVRSETCCRAESFSAAGDHVQHSRGSNGSRYLRDDVWQKVGGREAFAHPQPHRNRRINVAPGNTSNGEGHRQQSKSESERHAKKADTKVPRSRFTSGERRRQNGATASTKYQPKGPKEFCCCSFPNRHLSPPLRRFG